MGNLGDDIADTLERLLGLSQGQSALMREARARGNPDPLEFQNLIGSLFSGQCSLTAELNRLKSYLAAARTARIIPQRETPPHHDDHAHDGHAFAGAATGKMAAAGDHTFGEGQAEFL